MSKNSIVLSVAKRGTGLFPTDLESEEIIKALTSEDNYNIALNADRNLKMHRAYFSLLHFVWENLPEKLQRKCPKKHFYKLLKKLQGRFEVIQISPETELVEYESVAFDKMGQKRFHEVFKEDVEFIISDILPAFHMEDFIPILVTEYERTLLKYNL